MANLVDMKLSKEEAKTEAPCSPSKENGPRWPYGLRLTFDKEQIAKLPALSGLKVGGTVKIEGTGTVTSVRISERQKEKPDHTVEIQIENIGIEPSKKKSKEEIQIDKMSEITVP